MHSTYIKKKKASQGHEHVARKSRERICWTELAAAEELQVCSAIVNEFHSRHVRKGIKATVKKKKKRETKQLEMRKKNLQFSLQQQSIWAFLTLLAIFKLLIYFIQILLAACWLLKPLSDLSLTSFKGGRRNVLR